MVSPYFDFQFRVILIGDSTVGKSSLLQTFNEGKFTQVCDPTVGVDFSSRKIRLSDNKIIKLQLWDTAGQEKFKSITRSYYRNAVGALLVFDITNRESFSHISGWFEDAAMNMKCRSPSFILVGQKADLASAREVSVLEAECLAQRLGDYQYIETSALTGANVEQVFLLLAESVYAKMKAGIYTELGSTGEWDGIKPGYGSSPTSSQPPLRLSSRDYDGPSDQGCC
uniref:Ras-related protein Rab-39B n=1 Tax=Schistocephalus solidus TaxID=70667 RepID=A0A0X3PR49_SCHSO